MTPQVGGDALAALVAPQAAGEVDVVVEAGQADGDVRGAATDMLGLLAVGVPDDVDQGLAHDQEAAGHDAAPDGSAWSKSMEE
jgi:hypothetical protein